MTSAALAISNELEQVCSLAHLKASRVAEVPLKISNSLLDKTRLVMGVARRRYRSTIATIVYHLVLQSRTRLETVTSGCFLRRERKKSILTGLFRKNLTDFRTMLMKGAIVELMMVTLLLSSFDL